MRMQGSVEARRNLAIFEAKVKWLGSEMAEYRAMTDDEKFREIWNLGYEIHMTLEAYRVTE